MQVFLVRSDGVRTWEIAVEVADDPRPTILEVLQQVQDVTPDLAFRYGCRNARCGVCTVEVSGRPRLACRDRVRDGDRISALSTLPVLRDLVSDRSPVDHRLKGLLPPAPVATGEGPGAVYLDLGRCIACYACLDGCPLHAAGLGDPASLLRLQRIRLDPAADADTRAAALSTAMSLGLSACADCRGCRCGVGIRLVRDVIDPLTKAIDR
ncbi:MAG: succinate dehydrogenase / fumarate reductase iron-sulfur subunit [Myxococcota bacterium]|jgi:succinate dehydrogenase / fumarate reductase iron-sulfur subunit